MLVRVPDLQGGRTFVNKRPGLTLSLPESELQLYVLDGVGHTLSGLNANSRIECVRFGDWTEPFEVACEESDPAPRFPWRKDEVNGRCECELEVVFIMVQADIEHKRRNPGQRRKPEVVAVSVDGCSTFIDNKLSSLFHKSRELFLVT